MFLVVIFLHNAREMGVTGMRYDWVMELAISMIQIFIAEIIVDWIKHAFVTQYNNISVKCYTTFLHLLQADVINSVRSSSPKLSKVVDPSFRIAFVPLPLAAVVIRMTAGLIPDDLSFFHYFFLALFFVLFFSLIKILLRYLIISHCYANLPNIKKSVRYFCFFLHSKFFANIIK